MGVTFLMKIDYEDQAELYEKTRGIEPLVYMALSNLLMFKEDDIVLDFGCGTGNYLKQFVLNYGIKPYGVEPASSMREIAQKKLPSAFIRNGNHTYLPFSDILFNKIYSTDVVHHIQQLDLFFQNILSVAAIGAKFCICTESPRQLGEKYWIKYFPEILEVDLQRFHSIESIVRTGESIGWICRETLKIEDELIAPISTSFMERVRNKTLSAFHLITDEVYEHGLSLMEADYQKQILLHQHEGYTFILFERGEQYEI